MDIMADGHRRSLDSDLRKYDWRRRLDAMTRDPGDLLVGLPKAGFCGWNSRCVIFTDRMVFLSPSPQRQNTFDGVMKPIKVR